MDSLHAELRRLRRPDRRMATATGRTPAASNISTGSRRSEPTSRSRQPYTFSRAPSGFQSSAPATNTTILTDGVVGSPVTGSFCLLAGPVLVVGVERRPARSTSPVAHHRGVPRPLFGYPGWDALEGAGPGSHRGADVARRHRVHQPRTSCKRRCGRRTSRSTTCCRTTRGRQRGTSNCAAAAVSKPGTSLYRITPKRILCVSELQALDRIGYDPFDIRIAPPSPFTAPPIEP